MMINGKKCYCLLAVLAAIAAVVIIAVLHGYSILDWTASSWVGAVFIVIAVYLCTRCRIRSDEEE